jgi:predicted outer membrane protein
MFKPNRIVAGLFAGTAALMAASAANAQAPSAMDKQFMRKLCQGNHAEIAAGKIALKNSQDSKVQGVAKTIITEHTANDAKLHALAEKVQCQPAQQARSDAQSDGEKLAAKRGT